MDVRKSLHAVPVSVEVLKAIDVGVEFEDGEQYQLLHLS